ncbi:MAG TPA: zinc ABC transporter substrate-binding protein [Verrucomicrobia bacterium]|nr:zinc ABC transporter substrate-binding protein [Verrucomicrobiota bacterium]
MRIALAVLLPGFSFGAHAKLNVVATTPDIAAIAQAVGGNLVEITTLARPTEDAHFVDPKPSFVVKLNKADVLLHGGADLESGWLPKLLAGARNRRIAVGAPGNVPCNKGIDMLEVPAALDRSRGDIHAAGNPHYLADPENAKIVAQTIAEAFARLDPGSGAAYQENAGKFIERLDAKLAEWRKLLAPYRGAHMVAYHNSWPYFAWRFELKIDLFLEPKPGIPPSPAHLANVISRMKELGARVILHDPYLNRRTAETVARSAGARVVDVTQYPGGIKGTDGGYIEMMDRVVRAIAEALAEQ